MRNIYNISFSRAALLLLPFLLRQKIIVAFISAFMRPLESLNEEFSAYRNSIDTSVKSQICYMRGLLNDYYDYYERRIKIRTASLDKAYYLLCQDQYNKPNMLYDEDQETFKPHLLESDWQIGGNNPDFEIVLPAGYTISTNEENQMRALVNNHKLASKTYIITNG